MGGIPFSPLRANQKTVLDRLYRIVEDQLWPSVSGRRGAVTRRRCDEQPQQAEMIALLNVIRQAG